jgi:hypothetical protein
MILAGDEFGDKRDLKVLHPEKQMDAVNFERMAIPWRADLFTHVAQLVKLHTLSCFLSARVTYPFSSPFTSAI